MPLTSSPTQLRQSHGQQHRTFSSQQFQQPQSRPSQNSVQHRKEPKLTSYSGDIPFRSYKVKLNILAEQAGWDNDTRLAKLVEVLEGQALTFFSCLPSEIRSDYLLVSKKFKARFWPPEPPRTARNKLKNIWMKPKETLEEFAE